MRNIYKFVLRSGSAGSFKTIRPRLNGFSFTSVQSDYEHCAGLIGGVEGEVIFTRDDGYDLINDASFNTRFEFWVYKRNVDGVFEEQGRCFFFKTDCEFNFIDRSISVRMQREDYYSGLLKVMQKTYNVAVDLQPRKDHFRYQRQGVLQLYLLGSDTITNINSGNSWETSSTEEIGTLGALQLRDDYFFSYNPNNNRVFIGDHGLVPDVSGTYVRDDSIGFNGYRREDNGYIIKRVSAAPQYEIQTPQGVMVYQGEFGSPQGRLFGYPWDVDPDHDGTVFTSASDATMKCRAYLVAVFARIVSMKEEVDGIAGNLIADNDLSGSEIPYKYAYPVELTTFTCYNGLTDEPRFLPQVADNALRNAGRYFSPLVLAASSGLGLAFPIAPNSWRENAFWVWLNSDLRSFLELAGQSFTVRDAFPLTSILERFVERANERSNVPVSWGAFQLHSDFLYRAINPVTNELNDWSLLITNKSNVLVGDYDTAASRGDISLDDLLGMLYRTHRLKWYVTDEGRLKIEHESYFYNGGNYSGPLVGFDLTGINEPRTGVAWERTAGEWSYDKHEAPQRRIFRYSDRQSPIFEGYPLEVIDGFVLEEREEEIRDTNFAVDIDYSITTNESVSNEGFFLVSCIFRVGYEVEFFDVPLPGGRLARVQNGRLAYTYLVPTFWLDDVAGTQVSVNREVVSVNSTKRLRRQKVTTGSVVGLNSLNLWRTQLGAGNAVRVAVFVDSGEVNIEILHDAT